MITRDMVRHAKPDPDLFLAAAAVLGVEPEHVRRETIVSCGGAHRTTGTPPQDVPFVS